MIKWVLSLKAVFGLGEKDAVDLCNGETAWRDVPRRIVFLDFDGVLHRKMTGTFEHLSDERSGGVHSIRTNQIHAEGILVRGITSSR